MAPLLKNVLNKIKRSSIINGFSKCGIYPFNPDKPDYSKCLEIELDDPPDESEAASVDDNVITLDEKERKITQTVIKKLYGGNQEAYRNVSISELWAKVSDAANEHT